MKKVLSLLTLLLCAVVGVNATVYATYTVSLNSSATVTPAESDFFTLVTGGGFNTKYTGTYGGTSYTKGLKINSSSSITFSTTVKSNVTIVQSTKSNGTNKFKLGGQSVAHTASGASITIGGTAVSYTMTENTTNTYKEFVFTDVPATSGLAITNDGETGLLYVKVELTEDPAAFTKLDAPVVTFNSASGEVTITGDANADKVTYTTDGSAPTSESVAYDAENKPVVADGTTIKAIAIGSGSFVNSDVATETVYLTGITVATPVVNQFNGTVVITCATPNATIEYTTDGGANWNTYNRAFTLTANADIQVRASRASCTTSAVADATITAVAANLKTKTIVMGYEAFDLTSKKVLTGKSTDVANGYTLTMLTDQDKSWSGRDIITISEISNTRTTFCGSNGVQCKLDMPAGVKATQLRLYSYVNSATSETNCAWKEVNGENLNSTLSTVPMGAFSDVADYKTNPDLRIFPLDNVEGSITFTNGGLQTCFVIVLDVVEPISTTLATSGYSSFSSANAVDIANATDASDAKTLKAYTISALSTTSATLTEVTEVPANTGVVLKGTGSEAYSIPVIASAGEVGTNYLKAAVEATTVGANETYVISGGKICQFTGTEIPAGKAYLLATDVPGTGARELSMSFGEGEATGIQTIETTQNSFLDGDFYNVAGQRVALPTKGLYIVNGKKVVIK